MSSLALESFWCRLPVFRVVAERESLQEASRILRLSPSSISRSIRLLESELGTALFTRSGGRLRLTVMGRQFLEAVRRSMRLVDDGVTLLRGELGVGPFRLALPRSLVGVLALPAIARVRRSDPSFVCRLDHDGDAKALVAGEVDLLLTTRPPPSSLDVEVRAVGHVEVGVHCGREHPLYGVDAPSMREVLAHAFVGTRVEGGEDDGWPREHRRTIGLELGDLAMALEACVCALGLALVPVAAARRHVASKALRRIASIEVGPVKVFALRRPSLVRDRADVVLESLAASLPLIAAGA